MKITAEYKIVQTEAPDKSKNDNILYESEAKFGGAISADALDFGRLITLSSQVAGIYVQRRISVYVRYIYNELTSPWIQVYGVTSVDDMHKIGLSHTREVNAFFDMLQARLGDDNDGGDALDIFEDFFNDG